jgi:pimeloyl-ACP methyl ester carboxylesterase
MSTAKFDINRHQVLCSHIREYPRALSTEDQPQLFLSVKQYVPKNNPRPQPGDITIVASQANAFPKELYEPLWDDLLNYSERLTSQGKSSFRVREIWMADVAHQGESYVLNEKKLGNDPGWFDHSRDILHVINQFRMQPPIFGVGHSMGGAQLTNIALFHPRLFTGLILLDPVIQPRTTEVIKDSMRPNMAALSTFRRDLWPSRDAAREGFGKSPFYQSWDKRVFDHWIESGLRDCPTLLHPDEKAPKVTLTTPTGQEVYQFSRPNFQNYGAAQAGKVNRKTHADLDPDNPNQHPFYRWEPNRTFTRLEEIRPSVLYVSGEISDVSHNIPGLDETRLRRTGTGIGGSGGEVEGRVKLVELKGVGHLVVMEEKGRA